MNYTQFRLPKFTRKWGRVLMFSGPFSSRLNLCSKTDGDKRVVLLSHSCTLRNQPTNKKQFENNPVTHFYMLNLFYKTVKETGN